MYINTKKYLPPFVYGSIDGIITTFAIVAGSAGAGLDPVIGFVLGCANVIADGFSMASSNFLAEESRERIGVSGNKESLKSALVTFGAFILLGMAPLMSYFFVLTGSLTKDQAFPLSALFALIAFVVIGAIRGIMTKRSIGKAIIQTVGIGSIAAALSYFAGSLLQSLLIG